MCGLGGRPKQEGGHKRINISISEHTLKIMKEIKEKYGYVNFSQFIESLIKLYPELEKIQQELLETTFEMLGNILDMLRKQGKF